MTSPRYRVTLNGFYCRSETWDDPFQWDGKRDEVFIAVNTKILTAAGTVVQAFNTETETMGDTWGYPNRVQAGTASDRGGIKTDDTFPAGDPAHHNGSLNQRAIPPYVVWEGEFSPGREMVMITPTVWEWDIGAGFAGGWLDWQVSVDAKYGQRAKDIFGKIWPVSQPVFDAVSLGITTVGTLEGLWSPLGKTQRRPIGTQRNPADPDGFVFNPLTVALNAETAEYLCRTDVGHGDGIWQMSYADDPYLAGAYIVYMQVERIGAAPAPSPSGAQQTEWRWCSTCQGLFFGPHATSSMCPAGGTHTPPGMSHSGNYVLSYGVAPSATRQDQWRWCSRCKGLFYGPGVANSNCPGGGTHVPPGLSGSGNYALDHSVSSTTTSQSDWRWCSECMGLFFGGGQANSRCPAGGTHTPVTVSRSGNYTLAHRAA